MNFVQTTTVWRTNETQTLWTGDGIIEGVRDAFQREERRVIWMYAQEAIPALVVFVIFGWCGLVMESGKWAFLAAALLCLGIGMFLFGSIVRQRRKQAGFGDSVKAELELSS